MVDYVIHRNPNLCLIPTQSDTTNPNNPSDYLLIAHWLMVDYCLNTKKPQVSLLEVSSHSDLAVSYSHMGKPHTTIGVTAFHF